MLRSIVTGNIAFFGGGIFNSGTATIRSSSITHNFSQSAGGVKNGDLSSSAGTMTIQNSTISDNGEDQAGGVINGGIMTLTNSTIANNRGRFPLSGRGGISNSGRLKITSSTISGNSATFLGGGIGNTGIAEMQNSILALNTAPRNSPECLGAITSLGNNIIGDLSDCDITLLASDLTGDPGLGTFVDDGMPGRGHFPLSDGSQAVNAGNTEACLETDQLGLPRVGVCDIGAAEFQDTRLLVSIDIRPRSDANKINPSSTNNINVAILSVNGFDARTVDPNSVRFGATGSEAAPSHVRRRDVDGDGDRDLLVRFQIQDLGIQCGDTSATLSGQTFSGLSIIGSNSIATTGCKQPRRSIALQ